MSNEMDKAKNGGDKSFEYVRSIVLTLLLAVILLGIFCWLFRADIEIVRVNVLLAAIWIVFSFITLVFSKGKFWQDYRWMFMPAFLILVFLLDISWAQSQLSPAGLRQVTKAEITLDTVQAKIQYPQNIYFEEDTPVEIFAWAEGSFGCLSSRTMEISSANNALLFAVKPPSGEPAQWHAALPFTLSESANAVTLLVKPVQYDETDSQIVQVSVDGQALGKPIAVENRQSARIRNWKTNFLEGSGIIVSIIVALFAGFKQLEDEKNKQKREQIKQFLATFSEEPKKDFSKVLLEANEILPNMSEYERKILGGKIDELLTKDFFWKFFSELPILMAISEFVRFVDFCESINLPDEQTNPLVKLKEIIRFHPQSNLSINQTSRTLFKEFIELHPQSSLFIQKISKTLFNETIFFDNDRTLGVSQIDNLIRAVIPNPKLSAWLERRGVVLSPFFDESSPFTMPLVVADLLIKKVSGGFRFNDRYNERSFRFSNTWDAETGIFEYLKTMPSNLRQESFVSVLTQTFYDKFSMQQDRELLLHVLAETWISELAEIPTTYYAISEGQKKLLGRLLCWHGGSHGAILHRLEKMLDKQHKKDEDRGALLSRVSEWLKNMDISDLRSAELNFLLDLRPSHLKNTLLLNSMEGLGEFLQGKTQWLNMRQWRVVNFAVSQNNPMAVSDADLVRQCQTRLQLCSNGQIEGLEVLFEPHDDRFADAILAEKAHGSPGEMVRLGHTLLWQHIKKYDDLNKDLQIEDLKLLT